MSLSKLLVSLPARMSSADERRSGSEAILAGKNVGSRPYVRALLRQELLTASNVGSVSSVE